MRVGEVVMRATIRLVHRMQRLWWLIAQPLTLGVRVLLLDEDRVVLVRHHYDGGWYLPGGGVRPGETPEQAIRREAHEELGVTLGELTLFGVYSNFAEGKSDHIIVFSSSIAAREVQRSPEIAEVASFVLDALPHDTSPGTRRRLAELHELASPRWGCW
jgi:ADP-ribose pyrophosphatase YjhB (NUDIX family)